MFGLQIDPRFFEINSNPLYIYMDLYGNYIGYIFPAVSRLWSSTICGMHIYSIKGSRICRYLQHRSDHQRGVWGPKNLPQLFTTTFRLPLGHVLTIVVRRISVHQCHIITLLTARYSSRAHSQIQGHPGCDHSNNNLGMSPAPPSSHIHYNDPCFFRRLSKLNTSPWLEMAGCWMIWPRPPTTGVVPDCGKEAGPGFRKM